MEGLGMPESFEAAVKALRHIAFGNGAVLRIANRIEAAHQREVAWVLRNDMSITVHDSSVRVERPITGDLRPLIKMWRDDRTRMYEAGLMPSNDQTVIRTAEFLCDAIDLVNRELERENAALFEEVRRLVREGGEDARQGNDEQGDS